MNNTNTLEMERGLAGLLLVNHELTADVLDLVRPGDFTNHLCQSVFSKAKEFYSQGKPFDLLIAAQEDLIQRQITGYGDNLIVKAGEYQGGLASFAVNANSDDAQNAINEFLVTINQMKARA